MCVHVCVFMRVCACLRVCVCVCYISLTVCFELIAVLVSCSSELLLTSSKARDPCTVDHEHTKSNDILIDKLLHVDTVYYLAWWPVKI